MQDLSPCFSSSTLDFKKWIKPDINFIITQRITVCQLTSTSDQDLGFTAGETVQQGLGSDVAVQQRRRTSQLGQCEPEPNKVRLVAQEQSHCVPLLQLDVCGQSSGHPVAFLVCLAVSIGAFLEKQKLLVRLPRHFVQKTIQNTVQRFLRLEFAHPYADFNCSNCITHILQKVRVF